MTSSTLLRGSRVRLTALTQSDLPTIVQWHQNPEFLRLFDALPAYPKTEAALTQWLDHTHKSTDTFPFAVHSLDNNELIGYVELDGILWTHRIGGVSVAIGETRHCASGQGYGYEAMQLVLQFAFDELNLHRVQLTVFSYNERFSSAIALYVKVRLASNVIWQARCTSQNEHLQRDGEQSSRRYDMY